MGFQVSIMVHFESKIYVRFCNNKKKDTFSTLQVSQVYRQQQHLITLLLFWMFSSGSILMSKPLLLLQFSDVLEIVKPNL